MRVQLRARGRARRRGRAPPRASCAATSATRRRGATPARRPHRLDHYQNGARPADVAAAPARRRHASRRSTGTPRSARSRRGSPRCATRTAATPSSITAAAARGTTCPAPTPRRRAARSARATARARSRRRRPASSGSRDRMMGSATRADFEHCDVALFLGKNPWHSHSIPRARVTLKEIAAGSGAHADRRRSAPHRDRRARRHPPRGAPGHRRVAARRDPRRSSSRRTWSTTRSSPRTRAGELEPVRRGAARGADRRRAARAPASTRRWCAATARVDRRRARARELRGPRRADEPRLDAGQLPAPPARSLLTGSFGKPGTHFIPTTLVDIAERRVEADEPGRRARASSAASCRAT